MSQEIGLTIHDARDDVRDTVIYFNGYIQQAKDALSPELVYEDAAKKHTLYHEPFGMIACIGPWNFPLLNLAWQCGQALLAGNAVVYKHSEESPLFAQLLSKLVADSSIPPHVLSVVQGNKTVAQTMLEQDVDLIVFTGSTATGKALTKIAAEKMIPIITELGGSAPGIVCEDANIDEAIPAIYDARFNDNGQNCDALKRLFVHESKFTQVVERLTELIATKTIGDATDEQTDIGPVASQKQLEKLTAQIDDAREKGATVIAESLSAELHGAYCPPALLTNATPDMLVMQEEVFGPVLPIVSFHDESEAIRQANSLPYALGAYVYTTSKERYHSIAHQLQSDIIAHNSALYYSPFTPFGGSKLSGHSYTHGQAGFHEVTHPKVVSEEK